MNPDIVQVDGWFRSWPGRPLTRDALTAALRDSGIPGAVGTPDDVGDVPLVLLVHPTGDLPGTDVQMPDALVDVATTTGGAFLIDGELLVTAPDMEANWEAQLSLDAAEAPEAGAADGDPPDLLLGHLDPDLASMLAHHAGSAYSRGWVGDFVLAHFDTADADPELHPYSKSELPILVLRRTSGHPHLVVILESGMGQGLLLAPQEEWSPTYDAASAPALARLMPEMVNRNLAADSAFSQLLASAHFPDADRDLLLAALARPGDDQWSAGVLAALGLPTLVADVHEGRKVLEGARRVEPKRLWGQLTDAFFDVHVDENDLGRRGLLGRISGYGTKRPLSALLSIVISLALAAQLLIGRIGAEEHPWWHWPAVALATLLVLSAVAETVVMLARIRRRRETSPTDPSLGSLP